MTVVTSSLFQPDVDALNVTVPDVGVVVAPMAHDDVVMKSDSSLGASVTDVVLSELHDVTMPLRPMLALNVADRLVYVLVFLIR